jgi:hypothetical protein
VLKNLIYFYRCDNFTLKINISEPSHLNFDRNVLRKPRLVGGSFTKNGGCLMARIQISNDPSGHIIVSFPYDPLLVSKVKTIEGRRWHPVEKHWSFPKLDGMLEKILKVFSNGSVQIDPALKTATSKVKDTPSPFVGEGRGEGYNFEDLRKELASRKYSYKNIKG